MKSRGEWYGIPVLLTPRGFRFARKPDARNRCIGRQLKGQTFKSREEQVKGFKGAVAACSSPPYSKDD